MSLQMKFKTEENWDVDGIEDITTHEAALNMNKEDELWKFFKVQVDFFE